MHNIRTRIVRLTAATAVALGLGALGAGPALADEASPDGFGSRPEPILSVILDDDASPDGVGRGGIRSVKDGSAPMP